MNARLPALLLAAALLSASPLVAQPEPGLAGAAFGAEQGQARRDAQPPDRFAQLEQLRYAAARLPVAASLAALLALRPRRRGTPPRQAQVVQTPDHPRPWWAPSSCSSSAPASPAPSASFGAAGLVRYRAKIDDPKDAGVMLSTLAVGLASGVGLWMLASFSTLFVLAVLWVVESFEPRARQVFTLTVKAQNPEAFRPKLESLLGRHRLEYELRSTTEEVVTYEVRVPLDTRVDRLSNGILELEPDTVTAVEWEEKKDKK